MATNKPRDASHVTTLLDDDADDDDWEDNSFPLSMGDNKPKGGVSLVQALSGKHGAAETTTTTAAVQKTKQGMFTYFSHWLLRMSRSIVFC